MIRYYTALFSVFLLINMSAQSWCPPGATWTYSYMNWTRVGFARFTYVGDTMMAGLAAQKIEQYTEGYDFGTSSPFSEWVEPAFTTVSGDLVSIWNGATFDTLYNFSAQPGDSWQVTSAMNAGTITIVDTGLVVIDDIPLRYLVTQDNDTIRERIGSKHRYFFPWYTPVADGPGGSLRCYSDLDIDYQIPELDAECTFIMGMEELENGTIAVFPNPGTDHFTLQLPSGMHELTLFDAQGRLVLQQQLLEERSVISTAHLGSGIFQVLITDPSGRSSGHLWMKN
ncbi:MAG: T9SS type A sorting domain-containing protein [Bacteroidota bacterium]|nr:T9SS type A sorting domain-containing protein [Bacteroidota bacterium]